MLNACLKITLLSFLTLFFTGIAIAQTQDDFNTKLTEVYVQAADKKKALQLARELYKLTEGQKDLQSYANYLMLSQLFQNQTPDKELARLCKAKADQLLIELTGKSTSSGLEENEPNTEWLNVYFAPLFSTSDPQHAGKALQFLSGNPSIQNYNNYNYVAYAFEKNGDFIKAKELYEHAQTLVGNEKEEFYSFSYYTNFLSNSGEYLKAEELLTKMERLSLQANDLFKISYKSEALTSKLVYCLAIGDYYTYIKASEEQYDHFSKLFKNQGGCDPFSSGRYTYSAYAKELLKEYSLAEKLWQQRDSTHTSWINCHNHQFPNNKQLPLSILPVYLIKRGKRALIKKPLDYYIKETEAHYNSYSEYADLSIKFMKAQHLGFLGSQEYPALFKGVLEQIVNTKDFRASTQPFAYYSYFSVRDRNFDIASETYDRLFKLNLEWINDVIFSFGEKAFVTYYNSRLQEGYENYHSFVKIASEKKSPLFAHLSSQAYNNLLFTKSLSLKGTQKRKQAFIKANDPSIVRLYDEWIEKKQTLIRHYRKAEDELSDPKKSMDKQSLEALQDKVNHLENELVTKAKDFKKYLKIESPDWKTIRDQLQEGEAAIEMIRFQWRDQVYYSDSAYYAAYIITKSSTHPQVVYLPDAATELDNKFYKAYRNNIKFKLKDKESYNHYWKPIKEQLKGIKKVFFSPDGIYHLINMSTIYHPETGSYLLEELEIHYTTSSIDIQNSSTDVEIKNAVLIGHPSYQMEGEYKKLSALSKPETRSLVRNFREKGIADLPGTEVEVGTIKNEMEKHAVKVIMYTGINATEDKVYQLHSPDVLHIATHGYWSEIPYASTDGYRQFNAMVNSGLLLTGVVNYYSSAEYPDTYDGILTAYEAQNLDLENTSLVILSACETSLGHFDAGEGVYGLQRAFRAAGAKSIMTSLWKVDDEATKEFMILFYQNLLKSNNKNEAFIKAQLALKVRYPDPYFWGAFILTGK
jgi:CHAT domain-containing protein